VLVGEPERPDQPATRVDRLAKGRRVHVREPQLRRPEHAERAIAGRNAPPEPERALATFAMHERSGDIDPVVAIANRDLEHPARGVRIARDEVDGFGAARGPTWMFS